jgi:sugar fermentation stimulation protein A
LTGPAGDTWVEAKSVTLVEEGVALFPDAPTVRGRRHVEELAKIAQTGEGAAIAFIVQRPDATRIVPHVANDPAFAAALVSAARHGVALHGYGCHVSLEEIRIARELPVCPGVS